MTHLTPHHGRCRAVLQQLACVPKCVPSGVFNSQFFKGSLQLPFQFKAGQCATLGVDDGDKMIERAYSIVSSPYEQGLEFFMKLEPQGELTPQEYDLFKIGRSHLGNPGVVVGSETRFLLQDLNLALHFRQLVV